MKVLLNSFQLLKFLDVPSLGEFGKNQAKLCGNFTSLTVDYLLISYLTNYAIMGF